MCELGPGRRTIGNCESGSPQRTQWPTTKTHNVSFSSFATFSNFISLPFIANSSNNKNNSNYDHLNTIIFIIACSMNDHSNTSTKTLKMTKFIIFIRISVSHLEYNEAVLRQFSLFQLNVHPPLQLFFSHTQMSTHNQLFSFMISHRIQHSLTDNSFERLFLFASSSYFCPLHYEIVL